MNLEQAALHQRLQAFSLDQSDVSLSFSRRLARDNRWSLEYADRVIAEYKKFAFLAVAAGHPVTPSDQVDQVWHLHLLYTRSYWEVFCPQVLQTPLHHGPTQGGRQEQHKFSDWYEQTLTSYEQFFGSPPVDIWSPPQIRFGQDIHFVRVNTQRNWIVPKFELPDLRDWLPLRRNLLILPLFGLLFGMTGCDVQTIQINPLAESLSEFTIIYVWIGFAGLIGTMAVAGLCRLINRNVQLAPPLLSLLSLLLFGLTLYQVAADIVKPTGLAFIGFYLLAFFSGALFQACVWFWQPSTSTFTSESNLQKPQPLTEWIQVASWLGMTSLCGLGITRIFIGLSRERPVGYLTVLCMIVGFYTLIVVGRNLRLEHEISRRIIGICKLLVILSLIVTVPSSISFLWMKLGATFIWLAFAGLLLFGMFSNQTTYRSGRGTRSSRSSHSGDGGCGGGSDGGDGGGDGGGGGCGGCGGCGD